MKQFIATMFCIIIACIVFFCVILPINLITIPASYFVKFEDFVVEFLNHKLNRIGNILQKWVDK